jgi:hypothetical protein
MRRLTLAGIVLAMTVIPAHAGWLGGGGSKLPKPIGFAKAKVSDAQQAAPHLARRNAKYDSPRWGSDWARAPKRTQRPLRPSLR